MTQDRAIEVAVLNSREYQTALETLYIAALNLTLNEFEFRMHWYGTNDSLLEQFGSSTTENNTLTSTSTLGFTRNLAAGGQLAADIANSLVFTFSGVDKLVANSTIAATLTQPLLRGAGRWVRLDGLTQAERQVLYAVRTFARYRKQFYVNLDTLSGNGFLSLMLQVQTLRNFEANLKRQEENLRLHEAQQEAGIVNLIQVDQAFQGYQSAKLSLLTAQTNLEASLDSYKLALGLPPRLPVVLDESYLKPFELVDPALEKLQAEVDAFWARYREQEQLPPLADLRVGFTRLKGYQQQALHLLDSAAGELRSWQNQIGQNTKDQDQIRRDARPTRP